MHGAAPDFLVALEKSQIGDLIRQSAWIYPTANVAHVVAIVVFAGAIPDQAKGTIANPRKAIASTVRFEIRTEVVARRALSGHVCFDQWSHAGRPSGIAQLGHIRGSHFRRAP